MSDLLWAGDALIPDATYTQRPHPALVHESCGHPRAYGVPCRVCSEPPASLADEARARDAAYVRARERRDGRAGS